MRVPTVFCGMVPTALDRCQRDPAAVACGHASLRRARQCPAARHHGGRPGGGAPATQRPSLFGEGDRHARPRDAPLEPGRAAGARSAPAWSLSDLDRQPVPVDLRPRPARQPLRPLRPLPVLRRDPPCAWHRRRDRRPRRVPRPAAAQRRGAGAARAHRAGGAGVLQRRVVRAPQRARPRSTTCWPARSAQPPTPPPCRGPATAGS